MGLFGKKEAAARELVHGVLTCVLQILNEDGVAHVAQYKHDKKIYYYEDSYLPIEWTNQHGCGRNSKANCEIVLQYMCEDT